MGQPANDPGWGAIPQPDLQLQYYIHAHVVSTEVVITEPGCGCGFESFSLVLIDFMYYVCISYANLVALYAGRRASLHVRTLSYHLGLPIFYGPVSLMSQSLVPQFSFARE